MEDKKKRAHTMILEERKKLSITGVIDVESFDEETIILQTEPDNLIIKGFDLHINKLNIEDGELIIEGEILSYSYTENQMKNKGIGLFKKIFK